MTLVLRIVLVVVSLLTAFYIFRKIRQSKMQIEDSLFWLVFSLIVLIFSIFPQVADWCAQLIGVQATYNFLFLLFIFMLIVKAFSMSLKMSQMDHKISELTQEIAIKDKRIEELSEETQNNESEEE